MMAMVVKHRIESPKDGGVVRRPNGVEVHLWSCLACGVRVVRGARGRWQHFTNDGRKRGSYKTERNADLRWPYGASDDPVIVAVNEAIPRNLPEQVREEACQELTLAVLEGRVSMDAIGDAAKDAMKAARSGYQFSAKFEVSMDIPLGQDARTPLRDLLKASSVVDVAVVTDDAEDAA